MRRSDGLLGSFQGRDVRDAHPGGVAGCEALRPAAPLHPRPRPVDDDQIDAQAAHQREIVDDAVELRISGRLGIDLDDEGFVRDVR